MTCYMTCGTQTDGKPNQLLVMKMSKMTKISEDSKFVLELLDFLNIHNQISSSWILDPT